MASWPGVSISDYFRDSNREHAAYLDAYIHRVPIHAWGLTCTFATKHRYANNLNPKAVLSDGHTHFQYTAE